MELLLHIGTEKTGTTSLQSWLGKNREALRREGVFFPKSLGETRSIKLSMLVADLDNIGTLARKKHALEDRNSHREFAARTVREFISELEQPQNRKCRTCVISDEGLQVFLRSPKEIERLADLLKPLFSSIRVVLCLRPQVDYAVSLASTSARLGKVIDHAWFDGVNALNYRFNYDALLHLWESVFGKPQLKIIPYRRNQDSIAAFCDMLSIDRQKYGENERENSFLDWRYIRIMNNLKFDGRMRVLRVISGLESTERLQIGVELAKEITERFTSVNRRVLDRYPEIWSDDLTPNWAGFDHPENLTLVSRPMVEGPLLDALISQLVRSQNRQRITRKLNGKGIRALLRFQFLARAKNSLSRLSRPRRLH